MTSSHDWLREIYLITTNMHRERKRVCVCVSEVLRALVQLLHLTCMLSLPGQIIFFKDSKYIELSVDHFTSIYDGRCLDIFHWKFTSGFAFHVCKICLLLPFLV